MDNKTDLTSGLEYQHEPLPDASSYVRLMKIRFIDEKDDPLTLECELITCRIDESPAFYAISYSWGDPAQTARLRINGHLMRITQNCEVALCEAKMSTTGLWSRFTGRKSPEDTFYWCDAVCIDQLNKPEKEAQVASMGRIYRRAEKVLACLGAPVEGTDSQFLFRKLQSRSRQLRKIGRHWAPRDEFQVDVARASDPEWYRMVKFFLLSMPRCTIIRLCKALECLLGTAYFQRTWIYQELFLGRSVSVCCGSACVPISTIFGLAQVSAFLSSFWRIKPVDRVWRMFHPRKSEQQLRRYSCEWTRYFLWLLGAGSSPDPQKRSLGSLMWKIRYQECGDIRDKVYGTLSMVRWPDGEAISVDYGRDPFNLAIQAMAVIRKKPGGWDGRWYDAADCVARNLGLGAQPSEQLAEQIKHRALWSPLDMDMDSENLKESPFAEGSQQHDAFWGCRLVKEGNQWAFEGASIPFPGLTESRNVRIRTWDSNIRPRPDNQAFEDAKLDDVFLPPTAQPGDWCLMHSRGRPVFQLDSQLTAIGRYLSIDRIVLIAREHCHDPKRPLSIIGKGLIDSDLTYLALARPVAAEFKVYLADEDALTLSATTSMIEGSGYDGLVERERIGLWVSGSEASSYFNTRVCKRSYSSYAVRKKSKPNAGGY